jgi:hypothetical protein
MMKEIKKTSKSDQIKCIIVDITTFFETPSARNFPATVQEMLRSSQPERIDIDFEKYDNFNEDRIVEDLINKENSNKVIFVLMGVPPLSEVKEQFTSSKFDRYI